MDSTQFQRRNYVAYILEGTMLLTALAFLDVNSVIPIFINDYTRNLTLAGLASTLMTFTPTLGQLIVGPYIHQLNNMPLFIRLVAFFSRLSFFVMIPMMLSDISPYTKVITFLILFTILRFGHGVMSVPYIDIVGRTIHKNKCGKVLGYQQLFGGIGALFAGFLIKITMQNAALTSDIKYTVLFSLSCLLLFIASLSILPIKDVQHRVVKNKVSFMRYYKQLPSYLKKNKDFALMVYTQMAGIVSAMCVPFVILSSKLTFDLDNAQVSNLIYVKIIGTILGGYIFATISERWGNKYTIMLVQVIKFIIAALALIMLLFNGSVYPVVIVYIAVLLSGTFLGGVFMAFTSYRIDVTKEDDRAIYMVLQSIMILPFSFAQFFAGVIADKWGFVPLFTICIFASVIAMWLSSQLKTRKQLKQGSCGDSLIKESKRRFAFSRR